MGAVRQKYIGVTVGPIFDTINLSSSPAALWAASYFFSMLTRKLCEKLTENGIAEESIVTPYYAKDAELLNKKDGIGLFHDRVIFRSDGFELATFNKVKHDAVCSVAALFDIDRAYLDEYLMISAVELEAENPIIESAKLLDSLELAKPFVMRESINPIMAYFSGTAGGKNERIKATPLVKAFDSWSLRKDAETLKNIEDIIGYKKGALKKFSYYAIVRSDGDEMGKMIAACNTPDETRAFSEKCLKYCSEIADTVVSFGGVAIYSGGDDLLAILPCEADGRTVFDFVKEANGVFGKHFGGVCTLSFGVTVCYRKFPLYEALADSAHMLFSVAKSKKNCLAVRMQKHAGQSEGLIISNSALDAFLKLQDKVLDAYFGEADKKSEVLLSALHKLALFGSSFDGANGDEAVVQNLFENHFDSEAHKNNDFVSKTLPEFFIGLYRDTDICAIDESGIVDSKALTMCYILRVLKFFVEKGGEEQ